MSFGRDLRVIVERTKGRIEDVVTKTAFNMQSSIVKKWAVAEEGGGRSRANWQIGIGKINPDTSAQPGDDPMPRAEVALRSWKPGETIFISNSLPYAVVLEYGLYGKPPGSANGPKTRAGYSSQMVGGAVRLTVQDFTETLRKVAASVR